jgi:hypothetical protein
MSTVSGDLSAAESGSIVSGNVSATDPIVTTITPDSGGENSRILVSNLSKGFSDTVCRTDGKSFLFTPFLTSELFTFSDPSLSTGDRFGQSIAANQHLVAIGAPGDDDNGANSGAVYLFSVPRLNSAGTAYVSTQIKKILGQSGQNTSSFGQSVAIGSNRIVVGEFLRSGGGAAYIYDLAGNFIKQLIPTNTLATSANFGISVAIACGKIVIGARNDNGTVSSSGAAYIFDLDGNFLRKIEAPIQASNDQFGQSVAIGSGRIVVGAPGKDGANINVGTAYLYDIHGNFITEITDRGNVPTSTGAAFGFSVAAGFQRIVVGAPENSVDYSLFNVGGIPVQNNCGSIYIYSTNGDLLVEKAATSIISASTPYMQNAKFGSSLATGGWDFVVAGSPQRTVLNTSTVSYQQNGAVEITINENFGGVSNSRARLRNRNITSTTPEELGYSIAASGTNIFVGAPGYNGNIGRAYFIKLADTNTDPTTLLPNSNPRHFADLLDENK